MRIRPDERAVVEPGAEPTWLPPLRAQALAAHARAFQHWLESAARTLSQPSATRVPAEATLGDLLHEERGPLLRRYQREIGRHMGLALPTGSSAESDLQAYSRPPSDVIAEQRLLNELALQLRRGAIDVYTAVEQRLREPLLRSPLALAATALSPTAALDALRATLERLDLDLDQRAALYRSYAGHMSEPLAAIAAAAAGSSPGPVSTPAAGHEAAPLPDAAMLAALQHQQQAASSADAALARQLLGRLAEPEQSVPVRQRLGLLTSLLASLTADLDTEALADIEAQRWCLIKIVLTDADFLSLPGHPLRLSLLEACDAPDGPRRRAACDELQQMVMSATFVASLLPTLPALEPARVDASLDLLRQRQRSRGQVRLQAARVQVAAALDQATLAHPRPQGLRLFLRAGWGPLMTQRLLRDGAESASWQSALQDLEALLQALTSVSTRVRDFESRLADTGAELFAAGLRSERCERLLQALREAYYELRVAAPSAPEPQQVAPVRLPGDGWIEAPPSPLPASARTSDRDNGKAPRPVSDAQDRPDLELHSPGG